MDVSDIYQQAANIRKKGIAGALCFVADIPPGNPAKAGACMLVDKDGIISGTVGGGLTENTAINKTLEYIRDQKSGLVSIDIASEQRACFYIQYLEPLAQLYIFGAGHVGHALATLAPMAGFETTVFDPRTDWLEKLPLNVSRIPYSNPIDVLNLIPDTQSSYFFITSHSHQLDFEILAHICQRDFSYLGLIAGTHKIEKAKDYLSQIGIFSPELWEKIDTPAGLPIHAKSPMEIAFSVCAKLIQHRNK
ncbi:MAG: hypothetical protein GX587_01490 [Bacteroidales bacterium]|nr:hypothetical protein [Bacteroidales bacterium]